MGKKKILQIIPAHGWEAVFTSESDQYVWPLSCWALVVQENGDTDVEGMYAGDYVEFCETIGNFSHYRNLQETGADDGRE